MVRAGISLLFFGLYLLAPEEKKGQPSSLPNELVVSSTNNNAGVDAETSRTNDSVSEGETSPPPHVSSRMVDSRERCSPWRTDPLESYV